MDVLYPRCCGLDVHKANVVACRLLSRESDGPAKAVQTFGTTTTELRRLADWLSAAGVTHVAMESTGVYWQPIWNLLEGKFTLLLANAHHVKAVPGRKTDVRDAEWLADLLRHGLLSPSFVPARSERELRELTRYRMQLVRNRAAEVNRVQKTLEGANIKLGDVASDVLGVSGRAMLDALVAGTTDPAVLADLARGRLRERIPALTEALRGEVTAHQRCLLAAHLAHIDFLDQQIAQLSTEIAAQLRPFEPLLAQLVTIPGVGRTVAEVILAEIGTDRGRFPSAAHLASWAGMCPGNDQSAGKTRRGTTRKGSRWLRTTLIQAAHAAGRTKDTYLRAQYRRLAARRGKAKAAVAVGHTILCLVYELLTTDGTYEDLGPDDFDQRDQKRVEQRLVARLQKLGYAVTLTPAAA